MPEIRGSFPVDDSDRSRDAPCVLCSEPTSTRAEAPGLGKTVPLHVICAGWIVVAYRRAVDGRLLPADSTRLAIFRERVLALSAGPPV